jgi:hypothetical protein
VILSLIFKASVQGDEEQRFHRLKRTDNLVKLRITLHIRYVATFSRKTQPVRALSLISQAEGYAKGLRDTATVLHFLSGHSSRIN